MGRGGEKEKKKQEEKLCCQHWMYLKEKKGRELEFPLWMGPFGVASVSFCNRDEMVRGLYRHGLEDDKRKRKIISCICWVEPLQSRVGIDGRSQNVELLSGPRPGPLSLQKQSTC